MYYTVTLVLILALFSASSSNQIKKTFKREFLPGLYDDWWQNAVLYQIYPRSFKDSDNDGNGDLQGIISKLDHLQDMGVDGVWLSPIYKSPQVDNGYDISDYRDIDSMFGTLDDLKQLLDEVHKRNLKLILDYVPNHTSDQHAWFQASLKRESKYDEYYIWQNATYVNGERRTPNNWLSNFGGSAWEWSEQRQQYYFHQFSSGQPDLNYRNPDVVEEMKDVLRYWLNFGIDGFRMDAVHTLFEDVSLRNEPESRATDDPDNYGYLDHIYTVNQNETLDMIYQWRDLLNEFNKANNSYNRIMMTEVYSDVNSTMLYYVNKNYTRYGAHFTFNFLTFVTGTKIGFDAQDLYKNISIWLDYMPVDCTSNWVLGNHDQSRVSTRLGVENIDALNILASILWGVQITYQGEEIGQENGEVNCSQGYDPQAIKNCSTFAQLSRDFERTPFQWDNTTNAGFNGGNTTWLPVSQKYTRTNLAQQQNITKSHYGVYKTAVKIKKEFKRTQFDSFTYGYYVDRNLFYGIRETDHAHYSFWFNVDDKQDVMPGSFAGDNLPVTLASVNSQYAIGDLFNVSKPLKPKEAVLIKLSD